MKQKLIINNNGQGMVEFIFIFPLLLFLIFGLIQVAFIYSAKTLLNHSTFMAARKGALNHASLNVMELQLASSLAPFYLKNNVSTQGFVVAKLKSQTLNTLRQGVRIDIVHPTAEMFNAFAERKYSLVPCSSDSCRRNNYDFEERKNPIFEIPNDHLDRRSQAIKLVSTSRGRESINIQDVNLLKIKAHWCYPLEVPIINRFWHKAAAHFFSFADNASYWSVCATKTALENTFYLPLSSQAIIRMQTPIRCENGTSCTNLNTYKRT